MAMSSNAVYAGTLSGVFKTSRPTGVAQNEHTIPIGMALAQNYPNPFNPTTVISYQLPMVSQVSLKVYDLLGKEVATLVNEYKPAGSYEVLFDAAHLATGIYYYRLNAGDFTETKKMILLK